MSEEIDKAPDAAAPDLSSSSAKEADASREDFFEEGDQLADQVSDQITGTADQVLEEGPPQGGEEEAVLEEERVKDEIEIQIDLLKDPDWVVRREAIITLGEMGDERCVEPVLRGLRDGDWQVREVAIEAAGSIGSPAVEGLIRLLRDWDIRKYAIMALGRIRDERVLDPLLVQLRSDEFHEYATDALVELGPPAVEKLIAALKDRDETVRKQAVIALGRIQDPSAIDPLIDMLEDKDWFTRLSAAAALEQIHDERGRDAIKTLLKDPDMVVQMRVERILAGWKKERAATA